MVLRSRNIIFGKATRQHRQEGRRVVTGSAPAVGSVKGGSRGSPFRDIFIYRVDKEVMTNDLLSYITGKDMNVHKLQCVSHDLAANKSHI